MTETLKRLAHEVEHVSELAHGLKQQRTNAFIFNESVKDLDEIYKKCHSELLSVEPKVQKPSKEQLAVLLKEFEKDIDGPSVGFEHEFRKLLHGDISFLPRVFFSVRVTGLRTTFSFVRAFHQTLVRFNHCLNRILYRMTPGTTKYAQALKAFREGVCEDIIRLFCECRFKLCDDEVVLFVVEEGNIEPPPKADDPPPKADENSKVKKKGSPLYYDDDEDESDDSDD